MKRRYYFRCDECRSIRYSEYEDADGNLTYYCEACGKQIEYDPLENDPPTEED